MTITTTRLYQLIADKTDKETAESLTSYIDQKITEDLEAGQYATKLDIAEFKAEMFRILNANFKWSIGIFLIVGGTIISLALVIIGKLNNIHI